MMPVPHTFRYAKNGQGGYEINSLAIIGPLEISEVEIQ